MDNGINRVYRQIESGLPLHSEQRQNGSSYDNPNHPIWELWQRMAEIYGHQWASQQGDEPNDTWCQGLADLTSEQFGVGFRALLNRQDRWPPNLVEFRQLCLNHDPLAWERLCHKTVEMGHLVENKTEQEQRVKHGLDAIRALRSEVGL